MSQLVVALRRRSESRPSRVSKLPTKYAVGDLVMDVQVTFANVIVPLWIVSPHVAPVNPFEQVHVHAVLAASDVTDPV